MDKHQKFLLAALFLLFNTTLTISQSITGIIMDQDNGSPADNAEVSLIGTNYSTNTNEAGVFTIENVVIGNYTLKITYSGIVVYEEPLVVDDEEIISLGLVQVSTDNPLIDKTDELDAIVISESELEEDDGTQEVSSLLTASRDIFIRTASFNFSVARFRARGYNSDHFHLYLNGAPVNDLEDGRYFWSTWGGLNDMFRLEDGDIGLGGFAFGFGGASGASNIDLRASSQRKQIRVSYAASNRAYRNRLMATYSTGSMKGGWAVSLSGSRRWAQEGYIDATPYDAYAYYLSVDKKLNDNHSLNLVFFNAPYDRGRSTTSVQEMLDLAGTNYYNPYWGFQEGKKRNSRHYKSNQPIGILRHDWNISENTNLTTTAMVHSGRFGSTGLDWYNASDPRPDYWRRLPSALEDEFSQQEVANALRSSEELRQINWKAIYDANRINMSTIENVDGIEGNDRTGFLSKYIIQEQRFDIDKMIFNTNLQTSLSQRVRLNAGASFIAETNHVFKTVNDLLGGEFYVDYDKFAERDFPGDDQVIQNDLNNPNRILDVGDRFGYDYDLNVRNIKAWSQIEYVLPKVDFSIAAEVSSTEFWREGFVRNGKFPDNSFGESEKQDFLNYGLKLGATYKINGRNYVYGNALYSTRAPFGRNAYLSPRTRDQVVPNLTSEKVLGAEAGYILRYSSVKGRISAFYTQFEDRITVRSFYHDDLNSFVNFSLSGVDQLHRGIEAAVEVKLSPELRATAVGAIGQYTFDSRPTATISQDNNAELLAENVTIYQQDFYIPGTPQTAASLGLNYSSPKFWFASLSFNFFDDRYLDFNPIRRTTDAIAPITEESHPGLRDQILNQERLESEFTLDFFGGKSWRIGDYFIYLNAGINNLLNNQDFRTGGYEQSRFDFETKDVNRFPPRYFYAFGTNYFISLTLRI